MGRTWKQEESSYNIDSKQNRQEKQRQKKEEKRLEKIYRKQEKQNEPNRFDFQAYSESN